MSEIEIFELDDEHRVEVRVEAETVWLTQRQMAELFDKDVRTINEHVRNVFSEGELYREGTIRNFRIVRQEGARQVQREVDHYSLDMIISVGYRVSSLRATRFRQWATRVLREYLMQGYSLNEHRLAQKGVAELEQVVDVLARTLEQQALVTDLGREALGLIASYARTWRLLVQYDEQALPDPGGDAPRAGLSLDEACKAVAALREHLVERGDAGELFGRERETDSLGAILGNLDQTMFGESLYKTREERAAHLLYFVIKDHPFTDGNKRCGAFLCSISGARAFT